ncbi:P-loop containing nucleoside triphosphate hydrolase protein [Peniophora sp. CONT]|nr:P-loop containing nucleoside triphosphate hydrolase protein [Peniophora sp. CONT]
MDIVKSLVQPLLGSGASNSMIDGVKLVVLGGTVETARRMSSSAWSSFVNSFFLTAHFSEEDMPYDWLMLWLSRRPEWQRSREFETTTSSSSPGFYGYRESESLAFEDEEAPQEEVESLNGKRRARVVFQPTADTTHTIFYRGHWLRVKRGRKSNGYELLSISVVARNNTVLKQLVLQAKREYEAEAVHRIQIYFADTYGSWRWTDSRHKRPMSSIVLNEGVKEMLVADTKDFLRSEKWYADRGIPFRRGYLLYGVPGSGKSSLIHAIAGELTLDVYVVSLSSSWINDSTLTTLMGRVPARCIVLLEDLDAAFTRSTSREEKKKKDKERAKKAATTDDSDDETTTTTTSHRHRRRGAIKTTDAISDVNTLTLSGLLNALDGLAASEGRLLFATTNHLEKLDPALCRPGRMDVWIEFKNASKWQAKGLFQNFFPAADGECDTDSIGLEIPSPPSPAPAPGTPSSTLSSLFSETFAGLSSASSSAASPSTPSTSRRGSVAQTPSKSLDESAEAEKRAMEEHLAACAAARKPLSAAQLERLACVFAENIPDEEFSVAALQGCECPPLLRAGLTTRFSIPPTLDHGCSL